MADAREELRKLRARDELKALREKDAKPAAEADESVLDTAIKGGRGFMQGIEDAVPFVEPIRKAGYATSAAMLKGVDTLAGNEPRDFQDYYSEEQMADQQRMAQAREQAPTGAYGAGNLLGAGATAFAPTKAAGMAYQTAPGLMGMAGRVARTGGMSLAEESLSNPDQLVDLDRGMKAATMSGGIQSGVEALGGLGRMASKANVGRKALAGLAGVEEEAINLYNRNPIQGAEAFKPKKDPLGSFGGMSTAGALYQMGMPTLGNVVGAATAAKTMKDRFGGPTAKGYLDFVKKHADTLDQFAAPLKNSLKSGNAAFEATHEMLMENPKYSAALDERLNRGRQDYIMKNTDAFGKTSRP